MGKLFTPENINSGFNTTNSLNVNFDNIELALDKVLSRSGEAPNAMLALLDMNNFDIINIKDLWTDNLYVDGLPVPSLADIQDLWARLTPAPVTISGTYNISEPDRFRVLRATSTTDVVLPTDAQATDIPVGWYCFVQKLTTDSVTFSGAVIIESVDNSVEILEENAWVSAIKTASNTWALVGNLA